MHEESVDRDSFSPETVRGRRLTDAAETAIDHLLDDLLDDLDETITLFRSHRSERPPPHH